MASILKSLIERKIISSNSIPSFIKNNICYEVITGSRSYSINSEDSDYDICSVCIPYKNIIFPHLDGKIEGFGKKEKRFENWSLSHIKDNDKKSEYDLSCYNIIKYFQLCYENNPNMIDTLFVPNRCILYMTQAGEYIRNNRKKFLHKGCFHKFKGYSYSQIRKMECKKPEGKRVEIIEKYGYDVLYASHLVRLLYEVKQILETGDLDLEKNREHLKAIRRGEFTIQQIKEFYFEQEKYINELYEKSDLQYSANEDEIREILINCLEIHFGSLKDFPYLNNNKTNLNELISEIENVLNKYRN